MFSYEAQRARLLYKANQGQTEKKAEENKSEKSKNGSNSSSSSVETKQNQDPKTSVKQTRDEISKAFCDELSKRLKGLFNDDLYKENFYEIFYKPKESTGKIEKLGMLLQGGYKNDAISELCILLSKASDKFVDEKDLKFFAIDRVYDCMNPFTTLNSRQQKALEKGFTLEQIKKLGFNLSDNHISAVGNYRSYEVVDLTGPQAIFAHMRCSSTPISVIKTLNINDYEAECLARRKYKIESNEDAQEWLKQYKDRLNCTGDPLRGFHLNMLCHYSNATSTSNSSSSVSSSSSSSSSSGSLSSQSSSLSTSTQLLATFGSVSNSGSSSSSSSSDSSSSNSTLKDNSTVTPVLQHT